MATFRVLASETVYEGRIVHLRVDTVDLGGGRTVRREVVRHPGAVVMAPIDPEGRLLLVRQPRYAAGEALLELPAGTLDPGEEPAVTAQRELQEEVGFAAGRLLPAGGFYSAPGFCTEYLHFFVALDLRPSRLAHDSDEEIEVVPVSLEDARNLVRSGGIKDAKTIAGLCLLELQGLDR